MARRRNGYGKFEDLNRDGKVTDRERFLSRAFSIIISSLIIAVSLIFFAMGMLFCLVGVIIGIILLIASITHTLSFCLNHYDSR